MARWWWCRFDFSKYCLKNRTIMIAKEKLHRLHFEQNKVTSIPRNLIMQMSETKTLITARSLHRFSSTEEYQREYRVILMVHDPKSTEFLSVYSSAHLLTASVSTTGVTPTPSVLTWHTVHLGQDPLRFFQLDAFCGIHLAPGKTQTRSLHQTLDMQTVFTTALSSSCHFRLLYQPLLYKFI